MALHRYISGTDESLEHAIHEPILLQELLQGFVYLTKQTHSCHVILVTSDYGSSHGFPKVSSICLFAYVLLPVSKLIKLITLAIQADLENARHRKNRSDLCIQ